MADVRREFDVDIDVTSKLVKEDIGTRAMVYNEDAEKILPHPSGVYLEDVPVDPITGLCAFDYEYGSEHGFFKVDLLNNTVYDSFKSKDEILEILEQPIEWSLLDKESNVERLPHIGKHYELVEKVRPRSIDELADVLALIRPAKIGLLDEYLKNPELVRKNRLYTRPASDANYFKKSHAISYAYMVVCAMSRLSTRHTFGW